MKIAVALLLSVLLVFLTQVANVETEVEAILRRIEWPPVKYFPGAKEEIRSQTIKGLYVLDTNKDNLSDLKYLYVERELRIDYGIVVNLNLKEYAAIWMSPQGETWRGLIYRAPDFIFNTLNKKKAMREGKTKVFDNNGIIFEETILSNETMQPGVIWQLRGSYSGEKIIEFFLARGIDRESATRLLPIVIINYRITRARPLGRDMDLHYLLEKRVFSPFDLWFEAILGVEPIK